GVLRSIPGIPSLSPRAIGGVAAVGLPAVTSLVGATGALAGTITGAGIAGGAGALAGGGALATGLGTIAAVAIPAKNAISEASKAQKEYTETVKQYGRESTQAVTAKYKLDQALNAAPKGTRKLIGEARAFGRAWREETRSAQANLVDFLTTGIRQGRRLTPTLAAASARTTGALARETKAGLGNTFGRGAPRSGFGRGGQQPIGQQFIGQSAAMFDENLTQARRFTQFGTQAMMQISIAARPFLLDATRFMANWSEGWADSTRDIGKTRDSIGRMVPHVRSLRRLFGASGRLAFHVVMGGAGEGRSMVDRLTGQLETWDRWVQRNPRQVQQFFRRTVNSTVELAKALVTVGRELGKIGDALLPLLSRFAEMVTLAGSLGMLQPGALALGLGAYRGMRGAGGRGGGGMGAGGGPAVIPFGMGAGGGGRLAAMRAGYGNFRQYGRRAGVAGALGEMRRPAGSASRLGMAARGAGRAFLPVGAALGALDFATHDGNIRNRFQQAASGATLGLVSPGRTHDEVMDLQRQNAVRALRGRMGGTPRTGGDLRQGSAQATLLIEESRRSQLRLAGEDLKKQKAYTSELLRQRRAASGYSNTSGGWARTRRSSMAACWSARRTSARRSSGRSPTRWSRLGRRCESASRRSSATPSGRSRGWATRSPRR
ncbi:MAG: hypothetical protein LC798_13270, partial [Chloroflexi bacterium]|nr:hypothetical protein [Chloroflexota bacterium]